MNHVKNVAGNDVSLFLFRFELSGNGINFVLNEAIAADMYQDVDEKLKPHSPGLCGEVCHRSAKASRSENLQIEEPVCCG